MATDDAKCRAGRRMWCLSANHALHFSSTCCCRGYNNGLLFPRQALTTGPHNRTAPPEAALCALRALKPHCAAQGDCLPVSTSCMPVLKTWRAGAGSPAVLCCTQVSRSQGSKHSWGLTAVQSFTIMSSSTSCARCRLPALPAEAIREFQAVASGRTRAACMSLKTCVACSSSTSWSRLQTN